MDQFLTGKYTAIPAFIGIMGLVFWLTFNVIGAWLFDLLDMGITYLTDLVDALLTSAGVNTVIHSLVIDGIFNGVGSVLSFLPIIVTLFFFLSMLEDSGYMARVALVMDKLLRKIGLSGRSIVPMLIGFGCTVPFVMELPNYRIHGKGKCGFDTFYIIWFHRKSVCGNFSACCGFPSGIQPFVYTMCGCCFFH